VIAASSATLLAACPNSEQVATALAASVCARGASIIESEQHVDADSAFLFQRVRFSTKKVAGGPQAIERTVAELSQRLGMTLTVRKSERRPRLALFVSKYDHCLYDVLLRQECGELDCDVPLIISNHADASHIAIKFGVDFQVIDKNAQNKPAAEEREQALLAEHGVDLIVLARYMQVLSERFVRRYERRIINIHHSFLPAFEGAKPYHKAHERGVKLIGATAHYVTAKLDQGPIIEQDVVRCGHKDTIEDLVRKGRDLEKLVLARAVRWHLDSRVIVHGNRTIVFD
jgi:formyltetrahydrofolate deformylase